MARTPMHDCCFCAELDGSATDFHHLYPDLSGRIVLETDRFLALPSLGQLAPGHMLLVPRAHVTSFGELDARARREASELYAVLRHELGRHFSRPVAFEHGSPRGAKTGGCGITHAHVHFVPLGERRCATPDPAGAGWHEAGSLTWLDEAAELADTGLGYLMWHGPEASPLLDVASDVPSQHLRRHVAALLGHGRWDWRDAGAQLEMRTVLREFDLSVRPAGLARY